tara:strand:- start:111 stop:1073 length:963 start_codon:yes stop_codon:yes gene_type:complete
MKKILILTGDPNSINSEILYKTWKTLSKKVKKKVYLVSNYKLIKKQFKILGYKIKIENVNNIDELNKTNNLKIINVNLTFKNPFKVKKDEASRFIFDTFNLGHKLALDKKKTLGLINCPINKELLKNKFVGVTEYFANKCNVRKDSEVMLIKNEQLAVSPITTHINISEISRCINKEKIINKVKIIDFFFKKNFHIKPKIAILGLNPHNAELRKNSEEVKFILPAISKLKKLGIKASGPFVADTIFIDDYKKFDVIVGMYHDQVIAPFKSLFKFDAINMTLGLKYLRLSPDHGTASDIILKKKANPYSLKKCIDTIIDLR